MKNIKKNKNTSSLFKLPILTSLTLLCASSVGFAAITESTDDTSITVTGSYPSENETYTGGDGITTLNFGTEDTTFSTSNGISFSASDFDYLNVNKGSSVSLYFDDFENIYIGDGSTLYVLSATAEKTYSGSLTGSGTLIINGNSLNYDLILKGDLTEFTGRYWLYNNNSLIFDTTQLADTITIYNQGTSVEFMRIADKAVSLESDTSSYSMLPTIYLGGNTSISITTHKSGNGIYFGANDSEVTLTDFSIILSNENLTFTAEDINVPVYLGGGEGSTTTVYGSAATLTIDMGDAPEGTYLSIASTGARKGTLIGDTVLNIVSGNITMAMGGSWGGDKYGASTINMTGGTVGNLYGGNLYGGNIKGDITTNISGGEITGVLVGTEYASASEGNYSAVANITHNISGYAEVDSIRAGINGSNGASLAEMVLEGNVTVNISGNAKVYSNDSESILGTGGSYASVDGDVTIAISENAYVEGRIFAGSSRTGTDYSYDENTDTYTINEGSVAGVKNTYITISGGTIGDETDSIAAIFGGGVKESIVSENTNITISGGTINGNVYGGGDYNTYVFGNSNITISGGTINGDVYAAGTNIDGKFDVLGGVVLGDATITIFNDAVITGLISGSGENGGYVAGTSTLNFDAYAGSLSLADFDYINVYNASVLNASISLYDDSAITVYDTSSLSSDKVNIIGGTTTIDAGTDATFSSSDVNVSGGSTLNITGGDFSDNTINSETTGTGIFYVKSTAESSSALNLYNTTISNNDFTASGSSSIVYADKYATTTKDNVTTVIAMGSSVSMTGSTISNNTVIAGVDANDKSLPVQYYGLLSGGNALTLTNTDITGNTVDVVSPNSTSSYNLYGSIGASVVSITGGTISGNSFLSVDNKDNTNSGDGDIYGGLTYTSGANTASFTNVIISGNKTYSTDLIYGGISDVLSSGTLTISGTTYSNNIASNDISVTGGTTDATYWVRGGVIANYNGTLVLSDSTFSGNVSSSTFGAQGGALIAKKTGASTTLTNVAFTDNAVVYTGTFDLDTLDSELNPKYGAFGGAIYLADDASMTYNVNNSSNILISGNYVSLNGTLSDENGGFLYIGNPVMETVDSEYIKDSSSYSEAIFNVSEGATLTIGDGTAGCDSIASQDNSPVITKSGTGTMTVNSSMEYYYGALNIESGTMNINNNLGATSTSVAGGATLNLTGSVVDGTLSIGVGGDDDSTAYVVANGVTFNGDITLGSSSYSGASQLDITGTTYFADGVSIRGKNAIGDTVVNILSGFVSDNEDNVFAATLVDVDEVNIYGNADLVVEIEGETTLNRDSSLDVNFEGDEDTGETAGGSVTGADSLSLGEGTTLTGTISTTDVNSIYTDESATVSSDTAFVISNSSTDVATDLSGAVSFVDDGSAEEKTAYSVDDKTAISGNVSATYTTEDITADSSYVKAIETSTGTITLANESVVSSSLTVGDTTYTGVALTNVHGTGGLTVALDGSSIANGSVVANSPLTITKTSVEGTDNDSYVSDYEYSDYNLIVAGGIITTNSSTTDADKNTLTIDSDVSLVLTTDSAGTMSSLVNVGKITTDNSSIVIAGSASMLVGSDYTVADSTTVLNNIANWADINIELLNGEFSYLINIDGTLYTYKEIELNPALLATTSISLVVNVDSLSYFQNKVNTDNANEMALAVAVDSIEASTNSDETSAAAENSAKIDFKNEVEANGLGSYVMSANSYIAEVNTMLLGNQNFANVNRARSILEKSNVEVAMTEVEVVEEATGVSVVESEEIEAIKYSNVAQLQVISLMGNKNASNGVAGYDYYSVGSTANFDSILSDNALVGVSIGGTYNKVEGDAGDNANSTTFLLNAYAVYAYEGFEFFGNIGYAHFWNEGSKAGASADWDSDAFNGLVGVSYKMETALEGLSISPVAMLNLVCQDADSASYNNGVNVDDQSYFSAKLMLGFEVEYAINAQFNVLARAMYSHEMGDTTYDNTYSLGFLNGVNYIGSEAGADSAVMGLGLSYDFSEACTAYFDYNAYAYTSLITHSLNLSVAFKF